MYKWDCENCLLYGVAGCVLFRGCLSIEVTGKTFGTFRIVRYIMGVHFSGVSVSGVAKGGPGRACAILSGHMYGIDWLLHMCLAKGPCLSCSCNVILREVRASARLIGYGTAGARQIPITWLRHCCLLRGLPLYYGN